MYYYSMNMTEFNTNNLWNYNSWDWNSWNYWNRNVPSAYNYNYTNPHLMFFMVG